MSASDRAGASVPPRDGGRDGLPAASAVHEVDARPVRMTRIGYWSAAAVFVVFLVTAIVMPHDNAGAAFGRKDQAATAVIGVILAGLVFMLTRPRLHADAEGIRMRAFLGGWRSVPWDLVVAIEFPSNVRFARVVLPGEETLAIYAVQRLDGPYAVGVMRQLRALFAVAHPQAAGPPGTSAPGRSDG